MKKITIGTSFETKVTVHSENTAIAAESGSLPVFATPFMIALMEKATCGAAADFLENGETTVGTKINISHTKASGIGSVISARAEITNVQGRKITFSVSAADEKGSIIGSGTIERFVVLTDKFMESVQAQ